MEENKMDERERNAKTAAHHHFIKMRDWMREENARNRLFVTPSRTWVLTVLLVQPYDTKFGRSGRCCVKEVVQGYVSATCMGDASSRRLKRISSHAVIGARIWESSDASHCWTKRRISIRILAMDRR